ncbi:6180_t:CDS:2 [Paraglomus occultum]|uniref:6180_t:CDS:1 n=1 Tax=Paraglomus occultum TaxID=144539 RepID=A0A9N8WLW0_9GLOM|nr:6180_t:CDS:2 [Paraglomus occultum]
MRETEEVTQTLILCHNMGRNIDHVNDNACISGHGVLMRRYDGDCVCRKYEEKTSFEQTNRTAV